MCSMCSYFFIQGVKLKWKGNNILKFNYYLYTRNADKLYVDYN